MFLEELNRRIRENRINLRLSRIYLFKNIFRLPDHYHKTQRLSLSFRISRIYLVTQTTFLGILDSLPHSSQLQRLLFPISRQKYAQKKNNNILTQHSVNAHTKPSVGSKVCLSYAVGLIRR